MSNDTTQPNKPIEQIIDELFGNMFSAARATAGKSAVTIAAESLFEVFDSFRKAGFNESQAMFLCAELLTSQGGK